MARCTFILFLLTALSGVSAHAQPSDTTACGQIAKYLADSLVYPQMEADNDLEGKVIVQTYYDEVADTVGYRYLSRPTHSFYWNLSRTIIKVLKQPGVTACNAIFIVKYDLLYTEHTMAMKDSLFVPADSLKYLLELYANSTYQVRVEHGRRIMDTLDILKQRFDAGVIPPESSTEERAYSMYKKYGFKSIRKFKDSIVVRAWRVIELAPDWPEIFQLGLKRSGKSYARRYRYAHSWDKLPIDERELQENIIPTLIKMPYPPRYPGGWTDGLTYYVEVKVGNQCRYYVINHVGTYADEYGFWIDKKFEEVVKLLEGK